MFTDPLQTPHASHSLHLVSSSHFDFEMRFRHNGVYFFDLSTSKSGPKLRCLQHFDFDVLLK